MIRQSLCIPLYLPTDMGYDDFFSRVKNIGFPAVEFWQRTDFPAYEELIERAHHAGLVVASMCGHGTLESGLCDATQHERIEAELAASLDIAARHHIPGLICFSGNRLPGQDDYEGLLACAKGLHRIAKYAELKKVNLNIELLNSRIDHYNYLADHTTWGVALCEMVNSPRVKLLFDIYHMQIMEGDVIRRLTQYSNYIGHFHTAGNPGRHEMDDTQELNYRGICRAISSSGYPLYVGHEFAPQKSWLESLQEMFKLCDQ